MSEPSEDIVLEVRELLRKATPGPWHQRDPNVPQGENIIIDCGDPAIPHTLGAVATALNFAKFMSFTDGQQRCDEKMRSNAALIARAPELLRALADEVERLRRGEFTPEEFQGLCHNTKIQEGFDAFANGCEAYQEKLFGRCRKDTTT